jgi:hypothetical protein
MAGQWQKGQQGRLHTGLNMVSIAPRRQRIGRTERIERPPKRGQS